MSEPVLRLAGVRKHFGDDPVLRGIDLDVSAHEVVVLVGASGSGKSTLLRCICLLETVSDGTISLEGREITDPLVDVDEVRAEIGMVFQSFNLFPHLSVLDNVTLAPRRVRGRARADVEPEARALLTRFGLAGKESAYPDSLSGGQQQRVALVRAVAMRPKVLLLDEVTSALDPMLVGEVLDAVRELREEGWTIVMATHEISFARDVADRAVFLDGGVVGEEGSAEQVLTDPSTEAARTFLARHLHH